MGMTVEEKVKILRKVEDRLFQDMDKLMAKNDISPTEWKATFDALDGLKDAVTWEAMRSEYPEDMEEEGYSTRRYMRNSYGMPMDGDSYAMRRRSSNGQYMRGNTNSYAGGNNYYGGEMTGAVSNLRNLMNNATSESERAMYQRFLTEAEHYGR